MLNPKLVKAITIREYVTLELAMFEKECETLALIRSVRTDIINFSGWGATKKYSPEQIMPIGIIDNKNIISPIRNIDQALKLVESFKHG